MTQTTSLSVAILAGGPAAEAEVSRNSAAQIDQALQAAGHRTRLIELDRSAPQQLLSMQPDVAFPALHGPPGEDGTVQGMLEMLGIPYVGSDVRGSAVAMDKALAKTMFKRQGLPVSDDIVVRHQDDPAVVSEKILQILGPAVAIKPLNQGSAIGVQLLPQGGDLLAALSHSLTFGDCLVEPFVAGREITVGVLDIHGARQVHPVIEILTRENQWYDFNNRYTPGQSEHLMPAPVPSELAAELQRIALAAHECLGLRDLSRADFLLTEQNEIYLLEVNTLPGMTPTSLYPEGAQAIGYPFQNLVDTLVQQALARGCTIWL
jgi:D-alanine-D-alanine ligase